MINNLLTNKTHIIGADECGTGALCGPLVVCAVRASKDWQLAGLNDSKKLSPKKREALVVPLMQMIENKEITYHLAERSNTVIDKVGLAIALKDAYIECFNSLYQKEDLIIIDGTLKFDNLNVDHMDKISVIKADAKFSTVMAASIIGKVHRDQYMHQQHQTYPQYQWIDNVGYGSATHMTALKKYGPCSLHRYSYAPIKAIKDLPNHQRELDHNSKLE